MCIKINKDRPQKFKFNAVLKIANIRFHQNNCNYFMKYSVFILKNLLVMYSNDCEQI